MRSIMLGLARTGAATFMALLAVVAAADAQTLSPAGPEDLTIPPELRQGAPDGLKAGEVRTARRPAAAQPARRSDKQAGFDVPTKVRAPPANPVDFGVVMRGGSATARIVSPTGTSEAVQESGNAVGAAMRFGF